MKMFCATAFYKPEIKEVEVERVSESFIFYANGDRERLTTDGHAYRQTREEAQRWLIEHFERIVARHQATVDYYQNRLDLAKQLWH